MDVHGRPQTVLKTAVLTSAEIRARPPKINDQRAESAGVRRRLPMFDGMAVNLAVTTSVVYRGTVPNPVGGVSLGVPPGPGVSSAPR